MGETEITRFLAIMTGILSLLIAGIIFFIVQYRNRRLLHENEKQLITELHTKELLATQLEIQQQTMQDIGRELHDNIGQKLTLASIYAQQFVFKNNYPEANNKLEEISGVINDALIELRSLSRTLTNNYLQQTELTALIAAECERINSTGKCNVVYELDKAKIPLDDTKKKVSLRIVQEFLQNSLKHAHCSNINISVQYINSVLQIIAKDDGVGFDTVLAAEKPNGIGLSNMRKRAEMIGAQFTLTSSLQKGTVIDFILEIS